VKVWVTGAAGMLGQAIVEGLTRWSVPLVTTDHEVDICDPAAVTAFGERERPTHIVNCAAYTQVDAAESQEELATRVNGEGPAHLGRFAAALGASLAHVSTDYVFDGTGSQPYAEDSPTKPLGAYGRSKWKGEQGLWAALGQTPGASERGFVIRTSWLFGEGGKNFVQTMLGLAREREELRVVADQRGRPSYTRDLAEAIARLMGLWGSDATGQPRAPGGTYHFANAGETTWHGFCEGILETARSLEIPLAAARVLPVTTAEFPRPAPRPAYSVLDTQKIEKALGITPRPWQATLRDYLKSLR